LKNVKSELIEYCISLLTDKVERINSIVKSLKDAQANETKSSAGDKFETSREMMQSEIDKLELQLSQLYNDQSLLKLHKNEDSQPLVKEGSMIHTDQGDFLISAGIGKVQMASKTYFVISKSAPIAKQIFGLKIGDEFTFNNTPYSIQNIS